MTKENHPEWVVELFRDAQFWALRRAYFGHLLDDLTDDVDCSGSTIRTRSAILNYLEERLGLSEILAIGAVVDKVAAIVGYASGEPWERC